MISREIAENFSRRAFTDASIAQGIVDAGGLDVTACEAAGLAHDLGHPPFGHAGESELNRALRSREVWEGFEGNAQSFRIVSFLDRHKYEQGLDLTNVVLAAILKYPWCRKLTGDDHTISAQSKFGAYESEREDMERARGEIMPTVRQDFEGDQPPQSLEASIMDLADDIAYSIHDLEDFCSQGFIDLSAAIDGLQAFLANPESADNAYSAGAIKLAKIHADLYESGEYHAAAKRVSVLLNQMDPVSWGQSMRDQQLRNVLSDKIADFFGALRLSRESGYPVASLESPQWHEMQIMKQVTKHYLVATSRMGQIQRAQRKTIERLFEGLEEWIQYTDDASSLPETLRVFLAGLALPKGGPLASGHYRAIVDYICTMSDSEAFLRAQWVTGTEIPGMANLGLVD